MVSHSQIKLLFLMFGVCALILGSTAQPAQAWDIKNLFSSSSSSASRPGTAENRQQVQDTTPRVPSIEERRAHFRARDKAIAEKKRAAQNASFSSQPTQRRSVRTKQTGTAIGTRTLTSKNTTNTKATTRTTARTTSRGTSPISFAPEKRQSAQSIRDNKIEQGMVIAPPQDKIDNTATVTNTRTKTGTRPIFLYSGY